MPSFPCVLSNYFSLVLLSLAKQIVASHFATDMQDHIYSSHLSISEGFSLAYIGLSPLGKPLDLLSLL